MKQSILLSHHEAAGARLAEPRPDLPTPLTFGDVPSEYRAAREGQVLLDETDRGLVRVTGGDGVEFLHRLLANHVKGVAAGNGNRNLLLSAKGKVVHGFDLLAGDDEILLSTEPGAAAAVVAALDMYLFAEDVKLEDATDEHAPVSVAGPGATALVESLFGAFDGEPHHATTVERDGRAVTIVPLTVAGVPGVRLDAGPDGAEWLWTTLAEAGATPAGLVVRDILRCESGSAAMGVDVTDDVYPQEARLDDAFSLDKGCYIGQEVVAKIDTYGGLNKQLMTLSVSHDDPVPPGTELVVEEDGDRRVLGLATSWAYSFALDTGIVLAYVKRKHQEPGTTFRLGDGPGTATIVAPPVEAPAAGA